MASGGRFECEGGSQSVNINKYVSYSKDLCWHFDSNFLHNNHDLNSRTQIDLLKPSDRVERAIDTLGHYHKRTSAPGRPTGPVSVGIAAGFSRDYFFIGLVEFPSQGVPDPESGPRAQT